MTTTARLRRRALHEKGDEVAVITLWRASNDVAVLQTSTTYAATVAALEATGLVIGDASVETLSVDAGEFGARPLDLLLTNGR